MNSKFFHAITVISCHFHLTLTERYQLHPPIHTDLLLWNTQTYIKTHTHTQLPTQTQKPTHIHSPLETETQTTKPHTKTQRQTHIHTHTRAHIQSGPNNSMPVLRTENVEIHLMRSCILEGKSVSSLTFVRVCVELCWSFRVTVRCWFRSTNRLLNSRYRWREDNAQTYHSSLRTTHTVTVSHPLSVSLCLCVSLCLWVCVSESERTVPVCLSVSVCLSVRLSECLCPRQRDSLLVVVCRSKCLYICVRVCVGLYLSVWCPVFRVLKHTSKLGPSLSPLARYRNARGTQVVLVLGMGDCSVEYVHVSLLLCEPVCIHELCGFVFLVWEFLCVGVCISVLDGHQEG